MINIKIILLLSLVACVACGGGDKPPEEDGAMDEFSDDDDNTGPFTLTEDKVDEFRDTVTTPIDVVQAVADCSAPVSEDQENYIGILPIEESIVKVNRPENRGNEIAQTSEPEKNPNCANSQEQGVGSSRMQSVRLFTSSNSCVEFNNMSNSGTQIFNFSGYSMCRHRNKTAILKGGVLQFQGEEVPGCTAMVRPVLIQWGQHHLWVNGELKPTFDGIDGEGTMRF